MKKKPANSNKATSNRKPTKKSVSKVCTHCEKRLKTDKFWVDKNQPSGFKSWCKECCYKVQRATAKKAG